VNNCAAGDNFAGSAALLLAISWPCLDTERAFADCGKWCVFV
jgi:hypothetical protein